ncbi:hypothetical protein DsansV1_C07g0071801 [Dioscorea sansibarensis]
MLWDITSVEFLGEICEFGMAMQWNLALYFMRMVWMVLNGWVSACLIVADEIARAFRAGDVGPLPLG